MKNKYCLNLIHTPLVALALVTGTVFAGEVETTTATASTPAAAEDVVSGVLKLDLYTHFISYGSDVWADGSSMSDPTFNPMLELAIALPANFTFTLGTWWDVNNKVESAIGGRLQEVDVWAGLAYTYEKFTVGVTYQEWFYASDVEQILDVKFAYDCLLAPSLTVHTRLDEGAAGGDVSGPFEVGPNVGDTGTVLVLGLSHSIEAGPVTISFPFNLAYFVDDGFHPGVDGIESDNGFGYASLGVSASIPLTCLADSMGDWTLNGGLTYYVTEDDVIPRNPEDSFLTANIGLALAF